MDDHGFSYLTDAELDWLGAYLRARIAPGIALVRSGEHEIQLRLEGAETFLTLVRAMPEFKRSPAALDGSAWDAVATSWVSPGGAIPLPGMATPPVRVLEPTSTGWRLHFDVLGLCYWALCRLEEIDYSAHDDHARFPATASHAFRFGYLDRPVVDEWIEILRQVAQRLWPGVRLFESEFAVLPSHDVDQPARYGFCDPVQLGRRIAGQVLRERNLAALWRGPGLHWQTKDAIPPHDPDNTFDWMMDISEAQGLKSAFYFMAGRTHRLDAEYAIEHPAILRLMGAIHHRGHEIGFHPGYGTYRDPAAFRIEAMRFRAACERAGIVQEEWGGRMHYLRWSHPATLRLWAEAGFQYESTLGYADQPGFRCGTCHEYSAFDPVRQTPANVRVRPLVAMECSVMAPRYLGLGTGEQARARFVSLKEACRRVRGNFTILWHNSEFDVPAKRSLYRDVLAA